MRQHFFMIQVAANAVAFGLVALLVLLFAWIGPLVETRIFPIIKVTKVDDITRTHEKVCWTLHLKKVAWAIRPHYEWTMMPEQGPDIGAAAYVADQSGDSTGEDLIPHPTGEAWDRRWCANNGNRIPDEQGIRLTGNATHHRHNFWESTTRLPDMYVCPITGKRAGDCDSTVSY